MDIKGFPGVAVRTEDSIVPPLLLESIDGSEEFCPPHAVRVNVSPNVDAITRDDGRMCLLMGEVAEVRPKRALKIGSAAPCANPLETAPFTR